METDASDTAEREQKPTETQTTSDSSQEEKDELNKQETQEQPKAKRKFEKVKLVRVTLRPDRQKMDQRKNLSEHPFGTIKRAMGATYFLLKGKVKTTGEFALLSMAYNLARAENIWGFGALMQKVRG